MKMRLGTLLLTMLALGSTHLLHAEEKRQGDKPAKTAQAATNWTDSADGKISVCLSVDKKTFTPNEPIVVCCAVRNNTKEPLLLLRPFVDEYYVLAEGLDVLGPKGKLHCIWPLRSRAGGYGTNSFHELPAGMTIAEMQELRKDVLSGMGEEGMYRVRYTYVSGAYPTQPKPTDFWEGTVTSGEVQILVEKQAKPSGEKK